MEFKDKYTCTAEKDKKSISYDAYAIGDMLDELVSKIERLRLALLK